MRDNIGIWLDLNKALIIDNENKKIETLSSNIEQYNLHGGAKGKTPYATQDATSESKLLERRKQQTKRFFDLITKKILTANKVVVFGPAETKIQYQKHIQQDMALKKKLIGVETVGNKLTENQLKAWVQDYFTKKL